MNAKLPILGLSLFVFGASYAQSGAKKPKEVEWAKDTVYWNGEASFILDRSKVPTYTVKDLKGQPLFTMNVESYVHPSFKNETNPSGTKVYWSFLFPSLNKRFDMAPVSYGYGEAGDLAKFTMVNSFLEIKTVHFVKYATLNAKGIDMAVSMYGNRNAEDRRKLEKQ